MKNLKKHWFECCSRAWNSINKANTISEVTCMNCLSIIKSKGLRDSSCFVGKTTEIIGRKTGKSISFSCPVCGKEHTCAGYGPRNCCVHAGRIVVIEEK